jgi:transcriptional regulator with XRE-family HTH domain
MTSCSLALAAITAPAGLPPFISPSALLPIAVPTAPADNLSPSISHPVALSNRVREILWHIPWYGFKTQARLAQDSGVSPAAISRLIRGESQPSLVVALHITQALSRRLGRPLDVSEVFSLDGSYPTASVCHLTGCRNCLPPDAYDEEEQIKLAFQDIKSGAWSMCCWAPSRTSISSGS